MLKLYKLMLQTKLFVLEEILEAIKRINFEMESTFDEESAVKYAEAIERLVNAFETIERR